MLWNVMYTIGVGFESHHRSKPKNHLNTNQTTTPFYTITYYHTNSPHEITPKSQHEEMSISPLY